eukprot:m.214261 g.214261  ORF g.214261 m.214261 type:complete len:859 (+) comp39807_c1_seq7:2007-4583(+)
MIMILIILLSRLYGCYNLRVFPDFSFSQLTVISFTPRQVPEMTTLIEAVKERSLTKVCSLLESGANVNESDLSGRTPLYFAAQRGLNDIARVLVDYGARVSPQTNWGSTPLHVAADKGFDSILRLLTSIPGTSTNMQNKNGDSALHLAAYRGKLDAVRVLLDAGADVGLKNSEGRTPIEDAESNGHDQVAECLRMSLSARYRQIPERRQVPVIPVASFQPSLPFQGLPSLYHPPIRPAMHASAPMYPFHPMQPQPYRHPSLDMAHYSGETEEPSPFSNWAQTHPMAPAHHMASPSAHTRRFQDHVLHSDVSIVEKGEIESIADDTEKELRELRRKCTEKEQLEYKNAALNDALHEQQERLARLTLLEEKNSQLVDQLGHLQAQLESSHRPSVGAGMVQIRGSRLSEVAAALLGEGGVLVSDVEDRLAGILLKDVGCVAGIDFGNVSGLSGKGNLPGVKGEVVDESGREWELGKDYQLVESKPLNQKPDGSREGACSLVFRIEHCQLGRLILKVMINLVNMYNGGHGSGQSLTHFLSGQFGAEHDVPLQLPRHPNIVEIRHHYHGSTAQFTQFLPYIIPPHMDVRLELANKTTFTVMNEYQSNLRAHADRLREANPSPPYGFTEEYVFALLCQVASAIHHLLHFGVVHRDIKADNIFLDASGWRAVVADFGMARFLYRSGSNLAKPIQFVEPNQMLAGNSHAWAPEVVKYSRDGPPPDKDLFLPDLYAKADVYGIGTMVCGLLGGSGVGPLSAYLSSRLRNVLRGAICPDADERLSAREIEVVSGVLVCEPRLWHVEGQLGLRRWKSEELFKVALDYAGVRPGGREAVIKELKCRLLFTTTPEEMCTCLTKVQSFTRLD